MIGTPPDGSNVRGVHLIFGDLCILPAQNDWSERYKCYGCRSSDAEMFPLLMIMPSLAAGARHAGGLRRS